MASDIYYRYNCSECNGTNLIWRGSIYWDSKEKRFEADPDNATDAYCDDCDEEVKLKDNGEARHEHL